MIPPLRPGEPVRVRWENRSAPAVVSVASANGRSIVVSGEFILAGFVGHAPLLESADGPELETTGTFETLTGVPVIVERGAGEDA